MSEKDNGGPAFPGCGDLNDFPTINLGMSMRDYFAAKAMQGILSDPAVRIDGDGLKTSIAIESYLIADAMLKARSN